MSVTSYFNYVMCATCWKTGLPLNAKKITVLVFEREANRGDVKVVEQVDELVYLGCAFNKKKVHHSCRIKKMCRNRTNGALGKLLQSTILSPSCLNNSILTPTLLYSSEGWVCQKEHKKWTSS